MNQRFRPSLGQALCLNSSVGPEEINLHMLKTKVTFPIDYLFFAFKGL
jgi:hypothetical protein